VATTVRLRESDTVSWFENRGGGTFGPRRPIGTHAGDPLDVAVGDLDGDGDLDLVLAANGEDFWGVGQGGVLRVENLGGGTFGPLYRLPGGAARNVVPADLDRDGDLDLVASADGGGYAGAGFAWLENAGGLVFTSRSVPAGVGASAVGVADLDGDGVLDVATGWYYDDVIHWIPGACP
jgi:hypothetical protein